MSKKGPTIPKAVVRDRDPAQAERRRWVAHYAVLGWHENRIAQALKHHVPPSTNTDVTTVARDLKRLLAIWRQEATGDAERLFSKLSARLDHIAQTAIEEYRASMAPRVVRTNEGEMTLPPASQTERTALLNTAIRATAAQTLLHFGKAGGALTVNVDNRTQSVHLSAQAQDDLALRSQVGEMRRLLDDNVPLPKRRPHRPKKGPEILEADVAFARDMEAVVQSQGTSGNTDDLKDAS